MRIAPIVSLAVSIILGIAAVFIGRSWLVGQAGVSRSAAHEMAPAEIEMIEVLIARQDIETGTLVDAVVVQKGQWPKIVEPVGALKGPGDLIRLYDGEAYANGFIAAGEPIIAAKLLAEPPRTVLSAGIEPGKRAASIRVSDVTGVSGFVLPGDRVDVNLLITEGDAAESAIDLSRLESAPTIRPVLTNVLVLGVDQAFSTAMEGAAVSNTVTLEVAPDQTRALAAAGRLGQLTLSLIGQEEADALEEGAAFAELPAPVVAPQPVRRAYRPTASSTANIRIIHGANEARVQTPVSRSSPRSIAQKEDS